MEVLLLTVGSRVCALPLAQVAEVMRPLPLVTQAGLPDGVLGSAVARGVATPVVDCGLLLDGVRSTAARFVALKVNTKRVLLAVDGVLGTRDVEERTFRPTPGLLKTHTAVIQALALADSDLIHLLDGWRVLADGAFAQDPTFRSPDGGRR